MKTIIKLFVLLGVIACAYSCYDDTKIWEELQSQNQRIAALEDLCSELNDNMQSLQTIVKALQEGDYVTGVTPISEDGRNIGYVISFDKNEDIQIYHGAAGTDGKDGADGSDGKDGADGNDGATPIVGVKADEDGIYYWTLNGEWLLDDTGSKIKAVGTDGKNGTDGVDGEKGTDGVTPQLKIEDGYWYISYENGSDNSWKQLGCAVGEDGKDAREFFKSVNDTKDAVELELADGTLITLPKLAPFRIELDVDGDVKFSLGQTYNIAYTVYGADADAAVSVITSDGFKAQVIPDVSDSLKGEIRITIPKAYVERSSIVVMLSDGYGRVYMKALNFVYEGSVDVTQPIFIVTSAEAVNVPAEGGDIEIPVQTNMNYMIETDDASQDWLTPAVATRTALRDEVITLSAAANEGARRYGFVYVMDIADRSLIQTICIMQEAGETAAVAGVKFADAIFEEYVVSRYDVDVDGVLSFEEATKILSLDLSSMKITDLSGIEHMINLEVLECDGNKFTSLDLKSNAKLRILKCNSNSQLDTINLSGNVNLESLTCSSTKIRVLDLRAATNLKYLHYTSASALQKVRFRDASALEIMEIASASALKNLDLSTCTSLRELELPSCGLTVLDLSACRNLIILDCGGNNIEMLDLSRCTRITSLDCVCRSLSQLNMGDNPYVTSVTLSDPLTLKVIGSKLKSISCGGDSTGSSAIQSIDFSGCPNLESVSIVNVQGDLDLSNLPHLKTVSVRTANISSLILDGSENIESLYFSRWNSQYHTTNISVRNWGPLDLPKLKTFYIETTEESIPAVLDLSRCVSLENLKVYQTTYSIEPEGMLQKLILHNSVELDDTSTYPSSAVVEYL